jgi:hypothetical protein
MTKKLWFKAKRYGWGWTPSSWQGWLVLAIFVMFEVWNFRRLDIVSHSASDTIRPFVIQTFIATGVLLLVCWYTGEKPRWRWGGDEDK